MVRARLSQFPRRLTTPLTAPGIPFRMSVLTGVYTHTCPLPPNLQFPTNPLSRGVVGHPIIVSGPEAGSCSFDSIVFLASMDEDKGIEDGNPGSLLLKNAGLFKEVRSHTHPAHGPDGFDLQAINHFFIQTGLPFAWLFPHGLGRRKRECERTLGVVRCCRPSRWSRVGLTRLYRMMSTAWAFPPLPVCYCGGSMTLSVLTL
jgi:hypothetical protein